MVAVYFLLISICIAGGVDQDITLGDEEGWADDWGELDLAQPRENMVALKNITVAIFLIFFTFISVGFLLFDTN